MLQRSFSVFFPCSRSHPSAPATLRLAECADPIFCATGATSRNSRSPPDDVTISKLSPSMKTHNMTKSCVSILADVGPSSSRTLRLAELRRSFLLALHCAEQRYTYVCVPQNFHQSQNSATEQEIPKVKQLELEQKSHFEQVKRFHFSAVFGLHCARAPSSTFMAWFSLVKLLPRNMESKQ